jgi:predicted nucleotidyltransferase
MKTLEEIRALLNRHAGQLHARFGVKRLAIFGSFARGDQTPQSDVDILVELERPLGLAFFDLHEEIEKLLALKVDLATPDQLMGKPRLWRSVAEDLAYV